MTTDPTDDARAARLEMLRQRRRRHAAPAGRILAGGLSAAATLGLMGAMAAPDTSGDAPTSTPGRPPGAQTVVVRRATGAIPVVGPTTPPVGPAVVSPVTTSRGS